MRAPRRRFLRRGLGVIALFGAFLGAILGLGVLRFHAARLAYHLNSINLSIQQYVNEETALKQELSALVAPIKIYGYCKENLGMQKVTNAEALPVRARGAGCREGERSRQEGLALQPGVAPGRVSDVA